MTLAPRHAGDDFARLLLGRARVRRGPAVGELLGVEHEFVVRSAAEVVDFRDLIGGLRLPGRRLDPGDRFATRLSSGAVVTADGREAEIAIAPVPRVPGFAKRLDRDAADARRILERALPRGTSLEGYST